MICTSDMRHLEVNMSPFTGKGIGQCFVTSPCVFKVLLLNMSYYVPLVFCFDLDK